MKYFAVAPQPPPRDEPVYRDPCAPNPCGPYSTCRAVGDSHSCSCLPTYIGSPPNCRPECRINSECSSNLACIREKCKDPCPGSCGFNANCNVLNHIPNCVCYDGYGGDPFVGCNPKPPPEPVQPDEPICDCGPNTRCDDGVCSCLPEYFGDPHQGCRPECVLNSDCSRDKACIRNKCKDPCPGTCGVNAICDVINHIPNCHCPPGTSGNAFIECRPYQGSFYTDDALISNIYFYPLLRSYCSYKPLFAFSLRSKQSMQRN